MPAKIEIFARPVTLWRYRPLSPLTDEFGNVRHRLEEEMEAIKTGRVWCSVHDKMNDPMEGLYKSRRTAFQNKLIDQVAAQLYDEKIGLGIASFTETWDNELMWAHYAEGFRGICVGYSLTALLRGLPSTCSMTRVVYADRPRSLDLEKSKDLPRRARSVLSTKSAMWGYEREWRLFAEHPGPTRHGRGAVTHVLMGSRISDHDKAYVQRELGGLSVALYSTSIDGYEVSRTRIPKPKSKPKATASRRR